MDTDVLRPQQIFGRPIRYEIPPFQRPYIWDQEHQWEPLWDDVTNIAGDHLEVGQSKASITHFMGAVVFQQRLRRTRDIETRIVVDGQQRLTTLQLLIDAVQEVFERRNFTDAALRLSSLVENQEQFRYGDDQKAFKVWPTIYDQEAFMHAMQNKLSCDEYQDSRIVQAHGFF